MLIGPLLFLLVLQAPVTSASAQPIDLACPSAPAEHPDQVMPEPPSPHGIKHLGEHRFRLTLASGSRTFIDKPPFDELGGTIYQYCGYDTATHLHLIVQNGPNIFGGFLLNDDNGKRLPGGIEVQFSADRSSYLVHQQEDGDECQYLRLYTKAGIQRWQGESCLLKSPGGEMTYEFQSEHFDAVGNLVAEGEALADLINEGTPNAKPPQLKEFTLTRSAAGRYTWVPSK